MPLKVNEQSPEVAAQNLPYTIVEDVLAGTMRMRLKASDYLPKRLREDSQDYVKRVNAAVLFGGTNETLKALVGRAFADPMEIEDMPTWFEPIADNIDSRGKRLGVWAEEWLKLGITYGQAWALVDTPADIAGLSKAEQDGKTPYAVAVTPRSVLGWVYEGAELVQLRMMWTRQEREAFGAVEAPQVRVYDIAAGAVFLRVFEERQTNERKEWILVEGPNALGVKRIPVVRLDLTDSPPLLELAHHEIKLFQRESSADSLIDVAEVPILCQVGSHGKSLEVGANTALQVPIGGKVEFVEHTGKAIESGRTFRMDIKEAMRQIGARFIQAKNGAVKTATQSTEEAASDNSDLANMVIRFGDALTDLIDLIAEFAGESEQGTVRMHPNLKPQLEPGQIMSTVNSMVNAGMLSKETGFNIAKGLPLGIPDDALWAEEKVKIDQAAKEAAALEPKAGGFGK